MHQADNTTESGRWSIDNGGRAQDANASAIPVPVPVRIQKPGADCSRNRRGAIFLEPCGGRGVTGLHSLRERLGTSPPPYSKAQLTKEQNAALVFKAIKLCQIPFANCRRLPRAIKMDTVVFAPGVATAIEQWYPAVAGYPIHPSTYPSSKPARSVLYYRISTNTFAINSIFWLLLVESNWASSRWP